MKPSTPRQSTLIEKQPSFTILNGSNFNSRNEDLFKDSLENSSVNMSKENILLPDSLNNTEIIKNNFQDSLSSKIHNLKQCQISNEYKNKLNSEEDTKKIAYKYITNYPLNKSKIKEIKSENNKEKYFWFGAYGKLLKSNKVVKILNYYRNNKKTNGQIKQKKTIIKDYELSFGKDSRIYINYLKEVEKFLKYIKSKKNKKTLGEYIPKADLQQVRSFRNFKEETLKHLQLTCAKEITLESKAGKDFKLYERLVMPIIVNDVQIGVSIRKIRAKDNPKWFHAPPTIETGSILYNIDSCKDSKEIIVCEGIFDVWRWYEAGYSAVCTFGAHLTEEQYRMLLRSGKDIIWSYDGDSAGLNATKDAVNKMRYKVNQWVIHLPEGADPGNCTVEQLRTFYKEKERIL